jgi:ABC-type glycerol-3-phosphate transport system substrate-binding protein
MGPAAASSTTTTTTPTKRYSAGKGSESLSFWNGIGGPNGVYLPNMVKMFAEQEHVRMDMQVMQWPVLYDTVVPASHTSSGPDVLAINAPYLWSYVHDGTIPFLELEPYISGKVGHRPLSLDEANGKATWDAAVIKGKRYGIPLVLNTYNTYVNVDLINPEDVADLSTSQQVHNLVKAAAAHNAVGLGTGLGLPDLFFWGILRSYGGSFTSGNFQKVLLDDSAGVEACRRIHDFVHKYHALTAYPSPSLPQFLDGKIAAWQDGSWQIPGIVAYSPNGFQGNGARAHAKSKNGNFRWAMLPSPIRFHSGGDLSCATTAPMYCIIDRGDSAKNELAWRFVQWMNSHEEEFVIHGLGIPTRKDTVSKLQRYLKSHNDPLVEGFIASSSMATYARFEQFVPNFSTVIAEGIVPLITELLTNPTASPTAAASKAASVVQGALVTK